MNSGLEQGCETIIVIQPMLPLSIVIFRSAWRAGERSNTVEAAARKISNRNMLFPVVQVTSLSGLHIFGLGRSGGTLSD